MAGVLSVPHGGFLRILYPARVWGLCIRDSHPQCRELGMWCGRGSRMFFIVHFSKQLLCSLLCRARQLGAILASLVQHCCLVFTPPGHFADGRWPLICSTLRGVFVEKVRRLVCRQSRLMSGVTAERSVRASYSMCHKPCPPLPYI